MVRGQLKYKPRTKLGIMSRTKTHTASSSLKILLKGILLWPSNRVVCFQTLYGALFACLDYYILEGKSKWKNQASYIARLICSKQNSDGGFDIGYNFVFGTGLWKNSTHESTTPEMLGLYCLYRYQREIGEVDVSRTITNGIEWILSKIFPIDDQKWAISYAPDTIDEVHIINGCTFILPALAEYCTQNPDAKHARQVFDGLIEFLYAELEPFEDGEGKYWRYFYRGSKHFSAESQASKVDNYHLAQQLQYHSIIQQLIPSQKNYEIIEEVAKYLLSIRNPDGIYRYCQDPGHFPNDVQVWSMSSVIPAFIEAHKVLGNDELLKAATVFLEWIIDKSWNGDFFLPSLSLEGQVLDKGYYPRTQAWVLSSLTHYLTAVGYSERLAIIGHKTYAELDSINFRGPEKNVWTKRLIYAVRTYKFIAGKEKII